MIQPLRWRCLLGYSLFLLSLLCAIASAFVGIHSHGIQNNGCCVSHRSRYVGHATPRRHPLVVLFVRKQGRKDDDGGSRTSTTRRKRKRKQSKKEFAEAETLAPELSSGRSGLSERDLADHVASLYVRQLGGERHSCSTRNPSRSSGSNTASNSANYQCSKTSSFLDRHPALLLNADYRPVSMLPLSVWNWQEAVKSVFSGKVTVVDVYPDVTIRAASLEIPLPSVIALNEYVKPQKHKPAFTKRNLFLRDEYRCQYCNERFTTNNLSIDHVVPRCQGGRLHWENAATCCLPCNGKKGSLRVEELRSIGMRLLRKPSIPTETDLASIARRMRPTRGVHQTWEPYLGIIQKPNAKAEKTMAAR